MAVLFATRPGALIDNQLSVVGLPPTGPFAGVPNYKLHFKYQPKDPAAYTSGVYEVFNSGLDGRFDLNYFCCNPIDGGSA